MPELEDAKPAIQVIDSGLDDSIARVACIAMRLSMLGLLAVGDQAAGGDTAHCVSPESAEVSAVASFDPDPVPICASWWTGPHDGRSKHYASTLRTAAGPS